MKCLKFFKRKLSSIPNKLSKLFYIKKASEYECDLTSFSSKYEVSLNSEFELTEFDEKSLEEMYEQNKNEIDYCHYIILKERTKLPGYHVYGIRSRNHGFYSGYCSVAEKDVKVKESTLNYEIRNENEVYFFDGYIFKKHRSRGFHKFSIYERMKIFAGKSATRAVVIIFDNNKISQSSYKTLGFSKRKTITALKLLFIKMTFCKAYHNKPR